MNQTTYRATDTVEFVRATELPTTEGTACYADRSECHGPTADLRPCDLCEEIRARGDRLEREGSL